MIYKVKFKKSLISGENDNYRCVQMKYEDVNIGLNAKAKKSSFEQRTLLKTSAIQISLFSVPSHCATEITNERTTKVIYNNDIMMRH